MASWKCQYIQACGKRCGALNYWWRTDCRTCDLPKYTNGPQQQQNKKGKGKGKGQNEGKGTGGSAGSKGISSELAKTNAMLQQTRSELQKLQKSALASDSGITLSGSKQAFGAEPKSDGWTMSAADKRKAKKERRRLKKLAEKEGQDTNEPANGGAAAQPAPPTPPESTAQADLAESAVERRFEVDTTSHFDFKKPSASTKPRLSPEEAVDAKLPTGTADSGATAGLRMELEAAKKAASEAGAPSIKKLLETEVQRLEELLQNSSKKTTSKPARDKAELIKVKADLDAAISERAPGLQKHEKIHADKLEKFSAYIKTQEAKLEQLKQQYGVLAAECKEEWRIFNEEYDQHLAQMKAIVEKRIAAVGAESGNSGQEVNLETGAAQLPTALVQEAASAGDAAAELLLRQSEVVVPFQTPELRNVATLKPTPDELPKLAHLWEMIQTSHLEDPRAIITFGQCGLHANVWGGLIGDTIWNRMFAESQGVVRGEDAIPFQLRMLAAYQMKGLASTLNAEEFAAQRQAGEDSVMKNLEVIRSTTTRSVKGNKTRSGIRTHAIKEKKDKA